MPSPPPPRAPLPSVSGDTRAVGAYFARLETKVDDANTSTQQVASEWAGAQDRLDNLEGRLRECLVVMAKLSNDFRASASAHDRLAARVEASEAAVAALSQGTDALARLSDALRRRLTARSILMASFAALGGGCGSVLAPQIVKLFSQLRPHLKESPAMNDIYLALCHNPEIRAALLALAIYVTYNWLPRTPPATQPFRALWVVAEHLTWTSWQQAGVNYKGGLGPMPKLARKMVAEDSLLPGASDAPEDIDVTVIPAAPGVPK